MLKGDPPPGQGWADQWLEDGRVPTRQHQTETVLLTLHGGGHNGRRQTLADTNQHRFLGFQGPGLLTAAAQGPKAPARYHQGVRQPGGTRRHSLPLQR